MKTNPIVIYLLVISNGHPICIMDRPQTKMTLASPWCMVDDEAVALDSYWMQNYLMMDSQWIHTGFEAIYTLPISRNMFWARTWQIRR